MLKIEYIRDGLIEEVHEGVWVSAKPISGFSPSTDTILRIFCALAQNRYKQLYCWMKILILHPKKSLFAAGHTQAKIVTSKLQLKFLKN